MPKISALPPMTTADTADEQPIVDTSVGSTKKWTLTLLKTWLQSLAAWVKSSNVDYSTMALNMKSTGDTGTPSLSNGNNDFGSNCRVQFTVAQACKAWVIVTVSLKHTSDFEHKPLIYLDGVLQITGDYAAAMDNAGSRGTPRTVHTVVSLSAGAHSISAGVNRQGGAGTFDKSYISAIVLGEVTA